MYGYIVSVVALYIAKMGTLAGEAKGSHFISGAVPTPGYSGVGCGYRLSTSVSLAWGGREGMASAQGV